MSQPRFHFSANAWGFGWAEYEAGLSEGFTEIDSEGRSEAMYDHADYMETVVVNGDSELVYSDEQVHGLLSHPKVKSIVKTGGNTYDLNGASGVQWKGAFAEIVKTISDQNFTDSLTLYVNFDDWRYAQTTEFDGDSSVVSSGGISRIDRRSISDIITNYPQIGSIVPSKTVAANRIVGLIKSSRHINVLSRMPLAVVPIPRLHPFAEFKFEIWGSVAPQIKYSMPTGGANTEQIGIVKYISK